MCGAWYIVSVMGGLRSMQKGKVRREKRNHCEDKFYIKILAATGVLNSSFFALCNCSGQASNSFKDIS